MVNYQEGKVYKIVDNTTGNIYIGSTAEKYLSKRLQHHISYYKRYIDPNKKQYYMTSFEILKNNNYEILLLETCPCSNKYELEVKERYYIENNTCVNKFIPTRTNKEWYEDNKDKIKEQQKEYRENNKDKKSEKNKEYYENNKDKKKEYYEDNKSEIKEKAKEYYENNKDKKKEYYKNNKTEICEKNKQIVVCDLCGTQVRKDSLIRHKKTDKCKRLSVCLIEDD